MMTPALLIGCGALFLVEVFVGVFRPGVFEFYEPAARSQSPLRLPAIGAVLLGWGVLCIVANIPPDGVAQWFLLVLGVPFVLKGSLMIFWPSVLRHDLKATESRSTGWKVKCALRSLIGAALTAWGIIHAVIARASV